MNRLFAGALVMMVLVAAAAAEGQRSPNGSAEPKKQTPEQTEKQNLERDVARLLKQFDSNQDGLLGGSELPARVKRRFARLDANRDGQLSAAELLAAPKRRGRLGEIDTGPARGAKRYDTLRVGVLAPDFTLQDPTGKRTVTLSKFRGKKPVVLIFGSYT